MSLKTTFAFLELSHGWKNRILIIFGKLLKSFGIVNAMFLCMYFTALFAMWMFYLYFRDVRNTCLQLNVSFYHWDQEIPCVLLSFKIFKRFVLKLDKVYFSMLRCIALHCWISHALELALRLTSYRLQMRLHSKCNFEHYRS